MKFPLRDYQRNMVRQVHGAMRSSQRVCCVSPCGSGKRICATWWVENALKQNKRVLVVTNRRILIEQMASEISAAGIHRGIIMASEEQTESRVQIASIQTLIRRKLKNLPDADLIIIDESHLHTKAYDDLIGKYPNAKVIGLTATPIGPSGTSLIGLYTSVVEGVKNSELVNNGWLLPTEVWAPSEPDIAGVEITSSGEYNQKQLSHKVQTCTVFADVFDFWKKYDEMQTIVFVPRVKYAEGLAHQFRQRGITAEHICGSTSKPKRIDMIEKFKNRDLRVMVSVDVISVGFDEPIAQCAIDLQPNKQFRTFWQKIGRVKRKHGDQSKAIWLDFAGNYWRFLHPDDDPPWKYIIKSKNCQDAFDKYKKKLKNEGKDTWSCPECGYVPTPLEPADKGCPSCGRKVPRNIHKIRMKGGKLRKVKRVDAVESVKKTAEQRAWEKAMMIAKFRGGNMNMARAIYKNQTGGWPNHENLSLCPKHRKAPEWNLSVNDYFTIYGR